MMKNGFTLMEVIVATAVFSSGVLAMDAAFRHFNHQRRLERNAVSRFLCAGSAMEYLVTHPPRCGDSLVQVHPVVEVRPDVSCESVPVRLTAISGINPVVLVSVPRSSTKGTFFKRIVRCR